MSVSVVMPAYNAAAHIRDAIDSVVRQSLTDWELLVVDDTSTDDTRDIVKSYDDPRIRLIARQTNGGPARARNDGTVVAQYSYISYLDADDRLSPTALETLSRALDARPDAVLAYADFVRIDARGEQFGFYRYNRRRNRPDGNALEAFLRNNHMPNGGCAVIRRDIVLKAHCWLPELYCAEDWVAWTLLATYGEFVYVQDFKALEYRELESGLSHTMNIHFAKAEPSIDAVFRDPRVTGRFTQVQLKKLRSVRECNMWFYLSALNVRRDRWAASLACLAKAITKRPALGPGLLAKYALTALDRHI